MREFTDLSKSDLRSEGVNKVSSNLFYYGYLHASKNIQ